MEITEIEPENKIVLSKIDFSCDDEDEKIPKPLPRQLNFFMLIAGKPASGKTSLILNLIAKKNKCYNSRFDRIFVFSPSLITLKDDPFGELPDNQLHMEINKENLEQALKDIAGSGEKILFIMDDVVNDMKKVGVLILYSTKNKKEIDTIFDELILIPKDDYYQILKYCFDKKHNFIYIDINKSHDKMFHKCFNELSFKSKSELDI